MKKLGILMFVIALGSCNVLGQNNEWKTATANGGTEMKYRYSKVTNADGDEDLMVEFEATKTVTTNLNNVANCMNQDTNYIHIFEYVEETKNVGVSANGGWYLYEFIDAPWPVPNTDCILEVYMQRPNNNELIVYHTAKPNAYPMGELRRNEVSDMSFHFKKLDNGSVLVTLIGSFVPVVTPPKFLLNTWFPKGPEGIIDRIIEQSNKI